jgi:hypothetical protein
LRDNSKGDAIRISLDVGSGRVLVSHDC